MLGPKNGEQDHTPKRPGLSQIDAEHCSVCEITALRTKWGYRSATCKPMSVHELRNLPTDDTVVAEQSTPGTSTTNTTHPRADHSRGDTTFLARRQWSPSPDDIPPKPLKFVHFALPEAIMIPGIKFDFQQPCARHNFAYRLSPPASPTIKTSAETRANPIQPSLTPDRLVGLLS